jgi:hypothetical protein
MLILYLCSIYAMEAMVQADLQAMAPSDLQAAAEFVRGAMTGEEAQRMQQQHLQPAFSIKRCKFSQTSLCFHTNGNEKEGIWKEIPVHFSEDRNYLVQLLPRSDGQGFFEMPGPNSRIRLRTEDRTSLVNHPGIKHCGHELPEFYKAAQATREESKSDAKKTAAVAGGVELTGAVATAGTGAVATAQVGGSAAFLATVGAALPLFFGATVLVGGVAALSYAVNQLIIKGPWIFKCDGPQEGMCRVAMEAYLTPAIQDEGALA